jgi:hypothetical protein
MRSERPRMQRRHAEPPLENPSAPNRVTRANLRVTEMNGDQELVQWLVLSEGLFVRSSNCDIEDDGCGAMNREIFLLVPPLGMVKLP